MSISERETRDALREAQAPIELTGAVKILGVNCKMKTRPETDIGLRLISDVGRLDRSLLLVIVAFYSQRREADHYS